MSRPTVIITGAAGFVGTALRHRLIGHYRLVSLDRRETTPLADAPAWRGPIEEHIARVDLGDPEAVDDWWASLGDWRGEVVAVVQLAAYCDFENRRSAAYARLHDGLAHLLSLVARDLTPSAVFVQASSLSTLAPTPRGQRSRADSPRLARWRCARWKLVADELLDEGRLEQAVVQLVLGAIYSDDGELVALYEQIERVRRRGVMARLFPGDASHGLTYVHVQDVAEAIVAAIDRFHGQGGHHRFLVGQPEPLPYAEIQDRASEIFHAEATRIWRIPKWLAWIGVLTTSVAGRLVGRAPFLRPWMVSVADAHYAIDLSETRDGLGWTPRRRLTHDLNVLLGLARQDPERWHRINKGLRALR